MYILPSKKKYIVRDCDISAADPFRVKNLVICDVANKKERVYRKNIFKAVYCYIQCLVVERMIKKEMKEVSLEWRVRIKELYKWDFWAQYLGI